MISDALANNLLKFLEMKTADGQVQEDEVEMAVVLDVHPAVHVLGVKSLSGEEKRGRMRGGFGAVFERYDCNCKKIDKAGGGKIAKEFGME